ncbi:MAG: hypothetical protein JW794_01430 [Candidatus Cloacimonetes bacterium]|nr:hypothetical protein [Candidatus Cloacimonadota bacterium]
MKYFLITVDTEADWFSFKENRVTNIFGVHYLQELCDKYDMKPTYLVTYEIATKNESVNILRRYLEKDLCEIGHHLHVWSAPPYYKANEFGVEESLLEAIQAELPEELFDQKMQSLHDAIEKNFGITPRSHRAGKWGIDERTLLWLHRHDYLADSSLAPVGIIGKVKGIKKTISHNIDKIPNTPYFPSKEDIYEKEIDEKLRYILEVPVTGIKGDSLHNIKGATIIRNLAYPLGYKGVGDMMFRPSDVRIPVNVFETLARNLFESGLQWVNFMFHSNELGLGTSPYTKNETLHEQVRAKIELALRLAREYDYKGIFLRDALKYFKEE